MKGTCDYLDALRAHFGVTSDYALAKKLDVTHGCISNYRRGISVLSDDIALQVADTLGRPRSEVLLAIQAERAARTHNSAVAEAYADAFHKLGGMAA